MSLKLVPGKLYKAQRSLYLYSCLDKNISWEAQEERIGETCEWVASSSPTAYMFIESFPLLRKRHANSTQSHIKHIIIRLLTPDGQVRDMFLADCDNLEDLLKEIEETKQ